MPQQINDPNDPRTRSRASDAMMPDVNVCRDVAEGTRRMRDRGTEYLPKAELEITQDYNARKARSVLFNGFLRTVDGLTGMVFQSPPVLGDDVPSRLAGEIWEDVDNQGNHADLFIKEWFGDGLIGGHTGVLVDFPPVPTTVSRAEEAQIGARPYWVPYSNEDIISWRSAREGSATVLTQLVLREHSTEPNGDFGESPLERYRVYRRDAGIVTVQVYTIVDEIPVADEVLTVTNQTEIPFSVFYADRRAFMISRPPLLDLAHLNVSHYQKLSDHDWASYKASVPLLAVTGIDPDEKLPVGPNAALTLPDVNGKAFYVEHSGAALGQTRQDLKDIEARMGTLGLSMLQPDSRQAETAQAKRMDKAEQNSMLSTAARAMQDAVEVALGFTANFLKETQGGTVAIRDDFETLTIDADKLRVYNELVAGGSLSLDTLWSLLLEGGELPDDFDPDTERQRISQILGAA